MRLPSGMWVDRTAGQRTVGTRVAAAGMWVARGSGSKRRDRRKAAGEATDNGLTDHETAKHVAGLLCEATLQSAQAGAAKS